MFVSFEGIDGSGKSTQARLLSNALRKRGHDVVDVREPGGTSLGEQVRSLLLDPDAAITPRTELLLFSAARAQLVAEVIRPALNRGAIVLADRFFDSTTAYQGAGRELAAPDWMAAFQRFVTDDLSPDRTYLVDVPLDVAAARRGDRDADRMERGGDAFYTRVRDGYRQLAEADPGRVLVLDGRRTPDALHGQILDDLLGRLGNAPP